MVDITKCLGEKGGDICPLRYKCYRYTSKEGFWQSYFLTPPFEIKDIIACDMYLRESLWNDLNNTMI